MNEEMLSTEIALETLELVPSSRQTSPLLLTSCILPGHISQGQTWQARLPKVPKGSISSLFC
jgi:hypothetical protein